VYSIREDKFLVDPHSHHTGSFAQCKEKTAKKPRFSAVFLNLARFCFSLEDFLRTPLAQKNFRARSRASHVMLALGQQTKGE